MGRPERTADSTASNAAIDAVRAKIASLDHELSEAERNEAARIAEVTARLAEAHERQARAENKVKAMKGLVSEP
ncbi:MAG TPA: hypothetical protein VI997_03130 [Candidatus Thermoplasmatota archaeon]|nr:hypothetical protein [Candidatus Thermoplasmatota archaeon]